MHIKRQIHEMKKEIVLLVTANLLEGLGDNLTLQDIENYPYRSSITPSQASVIFQELVSEGKIRYTNRMEIRVNQDYIDKII